MMRNFIKTENIDRKKIENWIIEQQAFGLFFNPVMTPTLTSGSISEFLETDSPTSIIEKDFEKKLDEKYALLFDTLLDEIRITGEKMDNFQKFVTFMAKELNTVRKELNIQKLLRIANYKKNWDGYGSKRIDKSIINKVRDILLSPDLIHQPEIFATRRNSIQLEYHKGKNRSIEIEVFQNKYSLYSEDDANEREVDSLPEENIFLEINNFFFKSLYRK